MALRESCSQNCTKLLEKENNVFKGVQITKILYSAIYSAEDGRP